MVNLRCFFELFIENKNLANFKLKEPYQMMSRTPKNASFVIMSGLWDEVRTYLARNSNNLS